MKTRQIIYLFILLTIILLLFNQRNDLNINANEILYIKVYYHRIYNGINTDEFVKNINDKKTIDKIVRCFNYANKEPVKFIPIYRVVLYRSKDSFDVYVADRGMSIYNGKKYLLKCECSIENLIQ